ncbi:glycosyl hydrolase family 28-related protein, partial [Clostridioides difficile]
IYFPKGNYLFEKGIKISQQITLQGDSYYGGDNQVSNLDKKQSITNVSFDDEAIKRQIEKTEVEKSKLVPRCSDCSTTCNRNDN